jgi:restriction system protein
MEAIIAILSILYLFWPLILIFGTGGLVKKEISLLEKLRQFIVRVFSAWCVWGVFWLLIRFDGRKPILLLPESLNNFLFFSLGAVSGGVYLILLFIRWRHQWIRLANHQKIEDLLKLEPEQFETLVASIFRAYGHHAETASAGSDHGIDVIVHSVGGEKWIVQCKRYSGSVGEPIVRDLYGTMLHEGAQKAYLVTTGSYTTQAKTWADGKPIILYDGEKLVKLIRRTQKHHPKLRK